jgi:hypothetical protein
MVGVLLMVLASVLGRLLDFQLRGSDAYAGYCMAAASFLALAHTLKRGEHIRVTLLLERFGERIARALDLWCHWRAVSSAPCSPCTRCASRGSRGKFNDISQGNDATPLWIPQIGMALGAACYSSRCSTTSCASSPSRRADRGRRRAEAHRIARGRGTSRKGTKMDALITTLLIVLLFALLGSGLWIGISLMGVAWIGMQLFTSRAVGDAMAVTLWGSLSSWTLTALPLFVWMGEILFRTKLSEDMFKGLAPWLSRIPGGSCTPTSSAARSSRPCPGRARDLRHHRKMTLPSSRSAAIRRKSRSARSPARERSGSSSRPRSS